MSFKAKQFLTDHFQTPGRVVAFLRVYDVKVTVTEEAVRKWFIRDSLTGEWLATLLAYLELDRGEPISLARYL